jgi:hypothetical protein
MGADKPATKAARDVKAGDWISFGSMAWQAGADAEAVGGGLVSIPFGYDAQCFPQGERLTLHHDKT